jgi:DNA adenine methylase
MEMAGWSGGSEACSSFAAGVIELAPPLKWAGGKRWLVPVLRDLWAGNERRRLVEPFVGGLSVALGLGPEKALLNDVNRHLINLYRWLQLGLELDLQFRNDREYYRTERARFNALIADRGAGSKEAAQLFLFLNRTGYNGLCRFNSRGEFNVPFGRYEKPRYPRPSELLAYKPVLSRWVFTDVDYSRLELVADDFVYADPPYDVQFTKYSEGSFGWPQQEHLAYWLSEHQGPVVASNQATDQILKLYRGLGFCVYTLKGPRRIACNGDRTPALEMLAVKNLTKEPNLALATGTAGRRRT